MRIGEDLINLDLAMTPVDPFQAENYDQLYKLFQFAQGQIEQGHWTRIDDEFSKWDRDVLAILREEEVVRFNKPLRPHLSEIPECACGAPTSRMYHLSKILWARQGIEKYMDDTGF